MYWCKNQIKPLTNYSVNQHIYRKNQRTTKFETKKILHGYKEFSIISILIAKRDITNNIEGDGEL